MTSTIPTAEQVGCCYLAAKGCTPSIEDQECFRGWLDAEYKRIASRVRYTPQEVDPAQMVERFKNTGELLISSAHNNPVGWMSKSDNLHFRAIHDWHHLAADQPRFDWEGECQALRTALNYAPNQIQYLLASEIAGQAAVAISQGFFPSQKTVMLPLDLLGRLCGWSGFKG